MSEEINKISVEGGYEPQATDPQPVSLSGRRD